MAKPLPQPFDKQKVVAENRRARFDYFVEERFEAGIQLTGTDGSTNEIGVGNAAVRVGRSVDVVTYTTNGGSLTDVLTPAIDTSVSRLRTALARSASCAAERW